jgi:hypothetical protein
MYGFETITIRAKGPIFTPVANSCRAIASHGERYLAACAHLKLSALDPDAEDVSARHICRVCEVVVEAHSIV